MTTESVKKKLPIWAKVLITIVIIGIVGITALILGSMYFINQGRNPQFVQATADKIATISYPIAGGFEYKFGVDLPTMKMVVAQAKLVGTGLILASIPTAESSATAGLDKITRGAAGNSASPGVIDQIEKRGTEVVGGETMVYVVGRFIDKKTDRAVNGLAGCIVPAHKSETIMIWALEPQGQKFDQKPIDAFLSSIQKFN